SFLIILRDYSALRSFPTRRSSDLMLPIDAFDRAFRQSPDREALIDASGSVTFAQLRDSSVAVARGLQGLGVTDTGIVGIYSPNRDRKSTCLNSSHVKISYAVLCLK